MSSFATPLPPHYLPHLLASDTALYPSSSNLTLPRLQSWLSTAPSHSLLFLPDSVIIALPIRVDSWYLFLKGSLKEWDITPNMLIGDEEAGRLGASEAVNVGVHIWHVERGKKEERGFGRRAMRELEVRIKEIGGRKVMGWSALAVTDDGVGLNRSLGWQEKEVNQAEGGGMLMWIEGENWNGMV